MNCCNPDERSSRTFTRTPSGMSFTEDIKAIFSVLIICLDLKDDSKPSRKWYMPLPKTWYPYSFSLEEGVDRMQDLRLTVDMTTTSVDISFKIQPEVAYQLIETFMEAKLLHTPADRTRNVPKAKCILQPTPKGVSILQKYVRDIGLKNLPPILFSDCNSMELFTFERSSVTDSIIYSDPLVYILLNKMMGPSPNVWSPTNSYEKIPSLSKLLEYNTDIFSFENVPYRGCEGPNLQKREQSPSWLDQIPEERLHDENRVSPLAHKFFTNPDSDSHIQYYSIDSGLRICKSKVFGNPKVVFDYCFTTKAIWQWLMDCTDIMYPKDAVSAAALFLKAGLIVPISLPPSDNSCRKFCISRTSYYTLTRRAWDIVQWNTAKGIRASISKISNGETDSHDEQTSASSLSTCADDGKAMKRPASSILDSEGRPCTPGHQIKGIDDILRDPGMKYLFRQHLENEFCSENLEAFIDIKKFLRKMGLLKKLIQSKKATDLKSKKARTGCSGSNIRAAIDSALARQANECLELGYHIYSSYIVINSPYQLNIDHGLREAISAVMLRSEPASASDPSFRSDTSKENEKLSIEYQMSALLPSVESLPCQKSHLSTQCMEYHGCASNDLSSDTGEGNKKISNVAGSFTEDKKLSRTFNVLKELFPLLETVNRDLYHLMRKDSLQKFKASSLYQEAVSFMEIT
ncbi:hypothetical protein HG537_0A08600 [Torulaspora globosa]|uniref:RGS domain-containing protein n=1 Tax=Torulaspora globosa TaxID=48254 RepID=A0A7H9HMV3_9SACH|nr:hypothetical protein HG537_0A08600 [Torulaspora sp. CBS 2947]